MSYALSAFAVPQDQIRRFPGCGDEELLRQCLSVAQERLADLDEQLLDEDDDITHEQAFRELFSGDISSKSFGAHYGWAFETLCDCLGSSLSNRGFSPCNVEWYEQLDTHLATSNVTLRFDNLINNCPIDIPLSDDWPMIGHWSHLEIADSARSLAKLSGANNSPEMAEALATVNEWFNVVAQNKNLIIVGFHG